MSNELRALKQELQQKGSHSRLQDEELISAMREQVNKTDSQKFLHFSQKGLSHRVHLKKKKGPKRRVLVHSLLSKQAVLLRVSSGASAHSERAGAGGAFGERVSRKHRAEVEFGLVTCTPGSARPTQPAAQPTGIRYSNL